MPAITIRPAADQVDMMILADDRRLCIELTLPQAEDALAQLMLAVARAKAWRVDDGLG